MVDTHSGSNGGSKFAWLAVAVLLGIVVGMGSEFLRSGGNRPQVENAVLTARFESHVTQANERYTEMNKKLDKISGSLERLLKAEGLR